MRRRDSALKIQKVSHRASISDKFLDSAKAESPAHLLRATLSRKKVIKKSKEKSKREDGLLNLTRHKPPEKENQSTRRITIKTTFRIQRKKSRIMTWPISR